MFYRYEFQGAGSQGNKPHVHIGVTFESDRLEKIELQTLEHRRLIIDLVLYYNIVHGLSCINVSSFFTPSNNSSLRGHDFRFLNNASLFD